MTLSMVRSWMPAGTIFLAVVLQNIALPWYFWSVFRPDLLIICLVYWRLYRPDLCGPTLAFLSGIANDVLSGMLLGMSAATQLLTIMVVGHFGTRLRAADFLFLPPLLALLVGLEESLHWVFMSLFQSVPVLWPLFLGRLLATALVAPIVVRLLIRWHRLWLDDLA
ncbi:MAG: rod shape-determining protein MreD [Magnetococcales bacterium]|nr:rod shape-determining protein MreD [Magnetococcales bacterium]